ncbi:MAG: hypothetical protein IPK22_02215 [Verrucomicrobiaceae bacterium]|nr:hypothetical protein [Verrucomicrobiaceae bacterium]
MKLNRLNSIMAKSVATLAACTALNATAGTAPAPKNPAPIEPAPTALFDSIGATLDAAYDSRYYFRGLWFADNIVTTALNVSIPLTDKLTWGVGAAYISTVETPINNPTNLNRNSFDYSEIDVLTSLSYNAGWAKFGVQYQYYFYPDTYSGSNGLNAAGGNGINGGDPEFGILGNSELGFTVAIPVGNLNLGLGYFYDFTVGGSYFQASADYTIAVTDWLSIVPAIQTGYGIDYYTGHNTAVLANLNGQAANGFGGGNFPTSGFTHLLVSVAAPVKLTKSATFTPYVAWNHGFDLRSSLNATTHNEVFWGAKLSLAF